MTHRPADQPTTANAVNDQQLVDDLLHDLTGVLDLDAGLRHTLTHDKADRLLLHLQDVLHLDTGLRAILPADLAPPPADQTVLAASGTGSDAALVDPDDDTLTRFLARLRLLDPVTRLTIRWTPAGADFAITLRRVSTLLDQLTTVHDGPEPAALLHELHAELLAAAQAVEQHADAAQLADWAATAAHTTTPADPPTTFGEELRRRRLAAGLSLAALARTMHYSKGYLSKIETGAKLPSADLARRCDAALGAAGRLAELHATARATAEPDARVLALRAALDALAIALDLVHALDPVHALDVAGASTRDLTHAANLALDLLRTLDLARVRALNPDLANAADLGRNLCRVLDLARTRARDLWHGLAHQPSLGRNLLRVLDLGRTDLLASVSQLGRTIAVSVAPDSASDLTTGSIPGLVEDPDRALRDAVEQLTELRRIVDSLGSASPPPAASEFVGATVRKARAVAMQLQHIRADLASRSDGPPPALSHDLAVASQLGLPLKKASELLNDYEVADLRHADLTQVLSLDGIRWTGHTQWPQQWAAEIDRCSIDIAPGVREVREGLGTPLT